MGEILLPEPIHPAGLAFLRDQGHQINRTEGAADPEFVRLAPHCDALIVRQTSVNEALLTLAGRLKIVARYGSGFEKVDLAAATRLGVWVTNCPGANTQSVAEHVLATMVLCARASRVVDAAMRGDAGFAARELHRGFELAGKTLGLVGLGAIGIRVAQTAHAAFGMVVLAFDPHVETAPEPYVKLCARRTVFEEADVVSLHLPLTPQSRRSIGTDEFRAMKSDAVFLNTARGAIVDEYALLEALRNREIASAGVDVFSNEHVLDQFLSCERAVVTPHIAGLTEPADGRIATMAVVDVDRVLNGARPLHPVNLPD